MIAAAADAINREDFEALMDFYTEDATLVVKPGLEARGMFSSDKTQVSAIKRPG